jgi:hypothetical protein
MIRKKDNMFSVEFGWERPSRPIGSKPNPERPKRPVKPGKPKPKPKPVRPGTPPPGNKIILPIKEKPLRNIPKDFGKVLSQQPISMGEGYKDEINKIRPRGNGSAMNKQYRAQGGGRFK